MVMKMLLKSVFVMLCLWGSLTQAAEVDENDLMLLKEMMVKMMQDIKSITTQLKGVTAATEVLEGNIKNATKKQDLQAMEEKLNKLQQQTDSSKVAFSATLSTLQTTHKFIGPFDQGFTLVYENVLTNVGNAYDQKTGVFTAPMKGVYHFTFVVFHPVCYDGHIPTQQPTGISLLKNGATVVSATDNPPGADTEDTATNTVSLLLNQGDKISLQLWSNRRIYTDGNKRNTFSGHLLFTV